MLCLVVLGGIDWFVKLIDWMCVYVVELYMFVLFVV